MKAFIIWGRSMVEANMFGQTIANMRETGRRTILKGM